MAGITDIDLPKHVRRTRPLRRQRIYYYRQEELLICEEVQGAQTERKALSGHTSTSLTKRAVKTALGSREIRSIAGRLALGVALVAGERLINTWLERRALQSIKPLAMLSAQEPLPLPNPEDRPLLPPAGES
jgi:hypothetical protein